MVRYNLIKDFKVTTDMVAEPVDLLTAKKWLRVEFSTDDALITDIIRSVRLQLEKLTGKSLGYKSMTALIEVEDSCQWVELPYGPVDVINSIEERINIATYEALTESTSTVNGDYELFGTDSKIKLNNTGLFRFTYQGGYSELPEDLLHDMKVLTAWYYENRGHVMKGEQANSDIFPGYWTLNAHKYRNVF